MKIVGVRGVEGAAEHGEMLRGEPGASATEVLPMCAYSISGVAQIRSPLASAFCASQRKPFLT
jgi:hypothetical protein